MIAVSREMSKSDMCLTSGAIKSHGSNLWPTYLLRQLPFLTFYKWDLFTYFWWCFRGTGSKLDNVANYLVCLLRKDTKSTLEMQESEKRKWKSGRISFHFSRNVLSHTDKRGLYWQESSDDTYRNKGATMRYITMYCDTVGTMIYCILLNQFNCRRIVSIINVQCYYMLNIRSLQLEQRDQHLLSLKKSKIKWTNIIIICMVINNNNKKNNVALEYRYGIAKQTIAIVQLHTPLWDRSHILKVLSLDEDTSVSVPFCGKTRLRTTPSWPWRSNTASPRVANKKNKKHVCKPNISQGSVIISRDRDQTCQDVPDFDDSVFQACGQEQAVVPFGWCSTRLCSSRWFWGSGPKRQAPHGMSTTEALVPSVSVSTLIFSVDEEIDKDLA